MAMNRSYRVSFLGHLLKELGLEYFLELETLDPQYRHLKNLSTRFSVKELALISILGSIVAYRLSKRGEEYWKELVDYFSRTSAVRDSTSLVKDFMEFLQLSEANKLLLRQKLNRIERLVRRKFHERLLKHFDEYAQDLSKLWDDLAASLNANKEAKTVVFAVKMFYYAVRAASDQLLEIPYEIPIPVDLRVLRTSYKLGLISNYKFSQKHVKIVQSAWHRVAEISGIPPLHIDVLLWMLGSLKDYKELLLDLARRYKKTPVLLKIMSMVK